MRQWRGNGDLADVNEQELAKDGAGERVGNEAAEEQDQASVSETEEARLPEETDSAGELTPIGEAKQETKTEKDKTKIDPDAVTDQPPAPKERRRGGGLAMIFMALTLAAAVGLMLFAANETHRDVPANDDGGVSDMVVGDTGASALPQVMSPNDIHSLAVRSVVTVSAARDGQTVICSGVAVLSEGYVATLFDPVEGADSVTVTLGNGSSFSARVVGGDTDINIALLRTDASGLEPIGVVSEERPAVGERLYAVGALGIGGLDASLVGTRVAYGSRVLNIIGDDGRERRLTAIQISPSGDDSLGGCPLFNEYGEAVGMVVITDGSADFALPFEGVLDVLDSIKNGELPSGDILGGMVSTTARLGVACEDHEDRDIQGAKIISFESADSDAAVKLREGDVIIAVGGNAITCVSDLGEIMKKFEPLESAEVFVYREGQIISFFVKLY